MKIHLFVLFTCFSVGQCQLPAECVDVLGESPCSIYSAQGFCIQANIVSVCYKTCNPVICDVTNCTGMPTIASNGGNDPSGTTHQAGVTVTYTCDSNYILDGPDSNTCQANGSWTVDTAPNCKLQCPDPPTDASLYITPDGPYKVGDTITYECVNTSAEEIGGKESTCMVYGTPFWTLNFIPTCSTSNACGPPPMIASDGINPENRDYASRSTVTYQCNPRRVLGGSMTNMCTNNVWSNPAPVCYQDCVDHQNCVNNVEFGYCNHPDYVEDSRESCRESCGFCTACSEVPENQNVTATPTGPYVQGQRVNYTCDYGYIVGETSNICLGEDQWLNKSPNCSAWKPFSCDFESDICNFTHDLSAEFTWTKDSGGTVSHLTGPSVDHTLGTSEGYYMYIETSSPRRDSDQARLVSPTLTPTKYQCLRFYYHMFGSTIRTLEAYLKRTSFPNEVIWSLSGNQGDFWSLGSATITSSEPYQVVFEGTRGPSFTGDIAIDDVTITDGAC